MPPAANRPAWHQRFFLWIFSAFGRVDRYRVEHALPWQVVSSLISFIVGQLVGKRFGLDHIQWAVLFGFNVVAFLRSLLIGLILKFLVFEGLLPLLAYLPKTIANRTLGFAAVAVEEDASITITARHAEEHKGDEKVRVVCISGRHLFGPEETPAGVFPPLKELASKGKLEVLMPTSDVSNPTIAERFHTYGSAGESIGVATIKDFLAEIDKGKAFLAKNSGNLLVEHDILCMWRMVLFPKICIVQNYFPNTKREASYKAPTLVFEKMEGEPNCYYEVFSNMFEMIKRSAQELTAAEPPATATVQS